MRITKRFLTVAALLLLTFSLVTVFSGCKNDKGTELPSVMTEKYTVSYYEADGTTLIETRTFNHGDYITYPIATSKEGYLTQWKLYNTSNEEISIDKAVQNVKAVVNYELMDARVNVLDSTTGEEIFQKDYYYGDTFYTSEITSYTKLDKPGYIFKGFSDDGGKTFGTVFELESGLTLEAIYEPIMYKITFFDDDTYRVIRPTEDTVYGDMTLPAAPAKDGYTFDGWYVIDGYTTKRVGGKGDTYTVTQDTDFWAVYTKNETTQG